MYLGSGMVHICAEKEAVHTNVLAHEIFTFIVANILIHTSENNSLHHTKEETVQR